MLYFLSSVGVNLSECNRWPVSRLYCFHKLSRSRSLCVQSLNPYRFEQRKAETLGQASSTRLPSHMCHDRSKCMLAWCTQYQYIRESIRIVPMPGCICHDLSIPCRNDLRLLRHLRCHCHRSLGPLFPSSLRPILCLDKLVNIVA